jgi:hypothetical protein
MTSELFPNQLPLAELPQLLALSKELCGAPPVLSTENPQAYDKIFSQLIVIFRPIDLLMLLLIKEAADSQWEVLRISRHKVLLIKRRFYNQQKLQAQRRKAAAQNKEELAKRLAEHKAAPATEPEEATDGVVEEIDAMLLEPAAELEYARALELGEAYYDSLEKWLMMAIARRKNALAELDRHMDGAQRRGEAYFYQLELEQRRRTEEQVKKIVRERNSRKEEREKLLDAPSARSP